MAMGNKYLVKVCFLIGGDGGSTLIIVHGRPWSLKITEVLTPTAWTSLGGS